MAAVWTLFSMVIGAGVSRDRHSTSVVGRPIFVLHRLHARHAEEHRAEVRRVTQREQDDHDHGLQNERAQAPGSTARGK